MSIMTILSNVQKPVSERGVLLNAGACEAVAQAVSENVRQLEGIVTKLSAIQTINPRPILDDDVAKAWAELQSRGGQ